jgi:hypothetical protein
MLPLEAMKTSFVSPIRGSATNLQQFGQLCCISISCVIFVALFLFSSRAFEQRAFGATPQRAPRAFATAIMGATAQLNGARLIPGATLFRGDVVTLGADSSAAVQISGKNDLVIATPDTELVIESEGIRLSTGRIQIRVASADRFPVTGPFFHVDVTAAKGNSGSAEIFVRGESAQVTAVAGIADILINGNDSPYRLDAGNTVAISAATGPTEGGQASSVPESATTSKSPDPPQVPGGPDPKPGGKSPKTIYIISAAAGGALIGVGLFLSSREGVSPITPH